MSHEVESMVSAFEVPWHKLGKVVQHLLTSSEALREAGLDWTVSKQPLYAKVGDFFHLVKDHSGIVRDTDKRTLGVVGNRYRPCQNAEAFDFFDGVVGSKDAMYETAGSLRGGQKVFITAKMPNPIKVTGEAGDTIEKYLLFVNTHDGSGSIRMFPTPVRVVCANTLASALAGTKLADGIAIRHTTKLAEKLEAAKQALGLATKWYDKAGEVYQALAHYKMNDADMQAFAAELLPGKKEINNGVEVEIVPTRTTNNRMALLELFSSGVGQTGEVRGTGWAAYNAVTEYVDHHRGTRANEEREEVDVRADSILFGAGAQMKQKAFASLQARLAV